MTFTAKSDVIATPFVPAGWLEALASLVERSRRTRGGYLTIGVSLPHKPRTVGEKSQNHAINGMVQQICEATGNSFDAVKMRMKELAIDRGYPIETLPDGSVKPASEADISTVEASALIDTIVQFAAEWNIRLVEGDQE